MKFPKDVAKRKVLEIFDNLGFKIVKIGNHISMIRDNQDGSKTPLTMPNHNRIKGSTLRTICKQIGISRQEFLNIFEKL